MRRLLKLLLLYLVAGVFLTVAWNMQVETTCGRPMGFTGIVLGPLFMPIFTPLILWHNKRPVCDVL
jgi:hypothetical protein